MDRKAIFGYNVSGDNALYNNSSNFHKLSLDERKKDLSRESNRIWFTVHEDLIVKHIQKVAKHNRFSNWRKLPFVWLPCDRHAEIQDDQTMGIPSSPSPQAEPTTDPGGASGRGCAC